MYLVTIERRFVTFTRAIAIAFAIAVLSPIAATSAGAATLIEIEGEPSVSSSAGATEKPPDTKPSARQRNQNSAGTGADDISSTREREHSQSAPQSSSGLFAPYEDSSSILSFEDLPHWPRIRPDWFLKPMAGYYESQESFYDSSWQSSNLEIGGLGGLQGLELYNSASQLTVGVNLGAAYGQVITAANEPSFASFERRWLGIESTWLTGPWRLNLGGLIGHKDWHKQKSSGSFLPIFRSFRFHQDLGLLLKAAQEQVASVHLAYTEVRGLYLAHKPPFLIRRNLWPHLCYQFKRANFASGPGFVWRSMQQSEVVFRSAK